MSADLDAIISAAATSIDSGGSDGGDPGDVNDSTDPGPGDSGDTSTADVPAADAADAGADAGAAETAEGAASGQPTEAGTPDARTPEDIAFDAELAELGLSAPKPGQRDNRIPYSRIRKIVANAKTKWSEKLKGEHATELTARDTKIQEYEKRAAEFDAAERLIETDPDRYVALLATIYPDKYKGFTKAQIVAAEKKEMATEDSEPGPDIKYEDGSFGYSPEQHAKMRAWDRREAARQAKDEATKEFDKRFGPIEKEYRESQKNAEDVQRVRGHISKLRDQWGADHIDNPEVQKEIVAHLDANPKSTLIEAARVVVMKRISADRTKMRAEILKELQGAPRAAVQAPVAPVKSDAASNESIDDIIAKAARSIR